MNYESVKWEPFSADCLGGQNLKTLRVQETSTAMKWKTNVRTLYHFLFIIIFLLK